MHQVERFAAEATLPIKPGRARARPGLLLKCYLPEFSRFFGLSRPHGPPSGPDRGPDCFGDHDRLAIETISPFYLLKP